VQPENILVTGATGKVGRELIPLLVDAGSRVKAATRDPEGARALFDSRVEVVELNYRLTETYDAALAWADRMFLVPPPFAPRAYQAIGPLLDWAVSTRVGHIVLLSGMTVPDDPELDLRKVERHLEAQDTAHTILRPNLYMQNFHPGFISRQLQRDGRIRLAAGEARVSLVDVRDVAAVAARVLTTTEHRGTALTLTGPEALSVNDAVEVLAREAGRTIDCEAVDDAAFRGVLAADGWRSGEIDVILALFASIRAGARAPVHPDVPEVLGRPARSFAEFARELGGRLFSRA
jgi:uncharacterized protein YbjT (DUF2867 family)